MTISQSNYSYLNLARAVASYAVVWLHVSALVVTKDPSVRSFDWWIGNLADSAVRWCVPVFVMISGALLIPKAIEAKPSEFIKHRVPKILKPTIFWSIIYVLVSAISAGKLNIVSHLKSILIGAPYFHLWYMYMLIGLYLIAPYIGIAVKALDAKEFRRLTAIVLCLSSIESIFGGFKEIFFFVKFLPYVGYFLAGHLLVTQDFKFTKLFYWKVFLSATLLITILTAALFPYIEGRAWGYMYGYLNPLVIIQSMCMFLIIKHSRVFFKISYFTDVALGVYLIHPLPILMISYFGIDGFMYAPLIGIPLTTTISYSLSAGAASLMKYSPYLKQFV